MIGLHPGGLDTTKELLQLAALPFNLSVLELGAGDGRSAAYLSEQGYSVTALDLIPNSIVQKGDMTDLCIPDASFDVCLAECSVSVCEDGPAALREAARVLKPGGWLLLSDVYFLDAQLAPPLSLGAPATWERWQVLLQQCGLTAEVFVDKTALWRQFYVESIWNGNADQCFCRFFEQASRAKCGYFLTVCRKRQSE